MSSHDTRDHEKKFIAHAGIWVVAIKLGMKFLPKLMTVLLKLLKGVFGIKTAGAAASLGLYSLLLSWKMGVFLVAFIFIHEYGHLWAMKRCGIKTKGIYLIPGFGGVALAAEPFRTARNEALIALMGPLWGLFLVIPLIGAYFLTTNPLWAAIASILAFINLLNLFPIHPLDGGRIMKSFFYSFSGALGFFFALSSLVTSIFVSYYFGWTLLMIVAFIGVAEVINEYKLNKQLQALIHTCQRMILIFLLAVFMRVWISIFSYGAALWQNIALPPLIALFLALLCLHEIYALKGWNVRHERKLSFSLFLLVMLGELIEGVCELCRLRREQLEDAEHYRPMEKKKLALYGFTYIGTVALMLWLVLYTGNIPGADLAKEALR